MQLRTQLAEKRLDLELSQRELAVLANRATGDRPHLSASAISKIESGARQPSLAALVALAAGLDVVIWIEPNGIIILVQMDD